MNDELEWSSSPEKLARFFAIGRDEPREEDQPADDTTTAELLRDRLAGTLPLDANIVDLLPVILGRLSRELLPLGGRRLGEALIDPSLDLGVIDQIKGHAKKLASREGSEVDHAVATAIYYAAIAGALVFHGQKITTHSLAELDRSFAVLILKSWMTPELVRLFSEARRTCQAKLGQGDQL